MEPTFEQVRLRLKKVGDLLEGWWGKQNWIVFTRESIGAAMNTPLFGATVPQIELKKGMEMQAVLEFWRERAAVNAPAQAEKKAAAKAAAEALSPKPARERKSTAQWLPGESEQHINSMRMRALAATTAKKKKNWIRRSAGLPYCFLSILGIVYSI